MRCKCQEKRGEGALPSNEQPWSEISLWLVLCRCMDMCKSYGCVYVCCCSGDFGFWEKGPVADSQQYNNVLPTKAVGTLFVAVGVSSSPSPSLPLPLSLSEWDHSECISQPLCFRQPLFSQLFVAVRPGKMLLNPTGNDSWWTGTAVACSCLYFRCTEVVFKVIFFLFCFEWWCLFLGINLKTLMFDLVFLCFSLYFCQTGHRLLIKQ